MTVTRSTPGAARAVHAPLGHRVVNAIRRAVGLPHKPLVLDPGLVFGRIYRENLWRDDESRSGTGSALQATAHIRAALPGLLAALDVCTLLDAPCGDFTWMSRVDLGPVRYVGVDVVDALIESNRRSYARRDRVFIRADLARDPLPQADLILCRHLLIHLPYEQALAVLTTFRRTGARHLLITTNPAIAVNTEVLHTGGFRPLNMERPPFALPPALCVTPDPQQPGDPTVLGLYAL